VLDVAKRTGDAELVALVEKALRSTPGIEFLHRYVLNENGEPIALGPIVDVFTGGAIPDRCGVSRLSGVWDPSRARSSADGQRTRGRPRSDYVAGANELAMRAHRSWVRVVGHIARSESGAKPPSAWTGIDSLAAGLYLVSTGPTGPEPRGLTTIFPNTDKREREGRVRWLLGAVPPDVESFRLVAVPIGVDLRSPDAWKSPELNRSDLTGNRRRESVVRSAVAASRAITGRMPRIDPTRAPMAVACHLLRFGHGNLAGLPVGRVAQEALGLDKPLMRGSEDSADRRMISRHLAAAKRFLAIVQRMPRANLRKK
jgi:hypothetical protein